MNFEALQIQKLWEIQIQVSFTEFENLENPGIRPIHLLTVVVRLCDDICT